MDYKIVVTKDAEEDLDFFNIFSLKRKMNKQPEIFLTILEIH